MERGATGRCLEGRGIGVSGGGGHLGRALALGLAEAGAIVVICGRRRGPLETVAAAAAGGPGRVVAEPADVSRAEDLERVLDRIEKEAGAVHGWVNNATRHAWGGPWLELERAGVDADLAGVLGDVMLATQAAARRMLPRREGSIVNIASMYGRVSPQPAAYRDHPGFHSPPAYGAAKAGVIQFTRHAAVHLGPAGIRVNSVSPGPFPSPAARRAPGFEAELAARVALGRVGEAPELVGPVGFLLSPAASFVTGADLAVDGGWTAW